MNVLSGDVTFIRSQREFYKRRWESGKNEWDLKKTQAFGRVLEVLKMVMEIEDEQRQSASPAHEAT